MMHTPGSAPLDAPGTPGSLDVVPKKAAEVDRLVAEGKERGCGRCGAVFNFLRWRHRCRVCGTACCDTCTSRRMHLPSLGYAKPERVCEPCFQAGGGTADRVDGRGMMGKRVRVVVDHVKVRQLCARFPRLPEWDQRKSAFCGLKGTVSAQDPLDGTLRVEFDNGTHSWYPPLALLLLADETKPPGAPVEVERITVTCPSRPDLEGPYAPLEECRNSLPVYAMGPRRLYSNVAGHWVISATPEGMERESGAVQTATAHRGKGPHQIPRASWQRWQQGQWHTDNGVRLHRVLVPKTGDRTVAPPAGPSGALTAPPSRQPQQQRPSSAMTPPPPPLPVASADAQATAAATVAQFPLGSACVATGLVHNAELNGTQGRVFGHQVGMDGDVAVQVAFGDEITVALRPRNLVPVQQEVHADPRRSPEAARLEAEPLDEAPPTPPPAPPTATLREGDGDLPASALDGPLLGDGPLFSEALFQSNDDDGGGGDGGGGGGADVAN